MFAKNLGIHFWRGRSYKTRPLVLLLDIAGWIKTGKLETKFILNSNYYVLFRFRVNLNMRQPVFSLSEMRDVKRFEEIFFRIPKYVISCTHIAMLKVQ